MAIYELSFLVLQCLTLVSWGMLIFAVWKVTKPKLQKIIVSFVLLINALMLGLLFYEELKKPVAIETEEPPEDIPSEAGDLWSIEDVFLEEEDVALRLWKRNLLTELTTNLDRYRAQNGFDPVPQGLVESFGPIDLNERWQAQSEAFHLLDVRESAEFERFHLPGSHHARYGDLANDLLPDLPRDRKIVVVCYSGIRGYVVANLLVLKGYENVAFIRGGLGAWQKDELPLWGDENDFRFLFQQYPRLPRSLVNKSPLAKIDFSFPEEYNPSLLPNSHNFYGELATTKQVQDFMKPFIGNSVILVCHTESECFDGAAFAYEYRKIGGAIMGFIEINDR